MKKNLRCLILILGTLIVLTIVFSIIFSYKEYTMIDFSKYSKEQMVEIAKKNNIELTFEDVIDNSKEVGTFISQSVSAGKKYKDNIKVIIKLSKKEEKVVIDYLLIK